LINYEDEASRKINICFKSVILAHTKDLKVLTQDYTSREKHVSSTSYNCCI